MHPPAPRTPLPQNPPAPSGGEFGLSTAHNGTDAPRPPSIVAYARGGMIELDPGTRPARGRVGGGKRRHVSGFSKASRRRLLRLIGTIDQTATPPLFITLTYPATYPTARDSKKHLKEFLRQIRWAYPGASGIWKLEAQQRGAPHYHVLLWGVGFIPKEWVARRWWTICGCLTPEHLAAGTQVCRAGQFRRVWAYAAKYLGKVAEAPQDATWDRPGRFWGVFGQEDLPISPTYNLQASNAAFYNLRRAVWRSQRRVKHYSAIGRVNHFTSNPTRWIQLAAYYRQI